MDRAISAISSSAFLCLFLVFSRLFQASGNADGDALIALKTNLADPNNVLQNWNSTLVNPYTWFNVTCNSENSVTRVVLGNANLSSQLVLQLGLLLNLQYFNNISGRIPIEPGNLTSLVNLDLYLNNLSGIIPDTLGRLQKLRSLDLSNNHLTGVVPVNGSFQHFTSSSDLTFPLAPPPPLFSPPPTASGSSATEAFAGGVVAAAALLFLALTWQGRP